MKQKNHSRHLLSQQRLVVEYHQWVKDIDEPNNKSLSFVIPSIDGKLVSEVKSKNGKEAQCQFGFFIL